MLVWKLMNQVNKRHYYRNLFFRLFMHAELKNILHKIFFYKVFYFGWLWWEYWFSNQMDIAVVIELTQPNSIGAGAFAFALHLEVWNQKQANY